MIQPDFKFITNATNCEFDGQVTKLNDNAGAEVNKESKVDVNCIATALNKPKIFIPVPYTQ